MPTTPTRSPLSTRLLRGLLLTAACTVPPASRAQPVTAPAPTSAALQAHATEQVGPLLDSLKSLVAIESGSRDLEGLARLATLVASRLQAGGMAVQRLPTRAPDFHPQLDRKSVV